MNCRPATFQLNMETTGWKLKQMLGKWKEKQRTAQRASSPPRSEHGESTDQELEPVRLISNKTEVAGRSHKPCALDINDLFTDFQGHKPKVKIKIDESSDIVAQTETGELKTRLQQENAQGHGMIQRQAPGISWLKEGGQVSDLSRLPVLDSPDVCNTDREVTSLCKCPFGVKRLTADFINYVQLVKDKHFLLNNMFMAMCLHSRPDSINALKNCLHLLLSRAHGRIVELNSWSPSCALILDAVKSLGASEYYTEDVIDGGDQSTHSYSSQSLKFTVKLKSLLFVLTCAFKHRRAYTADEVLRLTTAVTKLSLDRSLIRRRLSPNLHSCVDALICAPSEEEFSHMEQDLCASLLSIANHHHNKLHIVETIPAMSERATELRMTLAFCAICQLLKEDTYDQLPLEWSMNSLANRCLSLEVNESANMYFLCSMISLFNIAVGNRVDQTEKESLLVMKDKLSTHAHLLREHPMRPDVTNTKCFINRVSLRWNWLAIDATPVEELLDIKHKPTPTKVIPVNSQEVQMGSCEDEQEDGCSDETLATPLTPSTSSFTDQQTSTDRIQTHPMEISEESTKHHSTSPSHEEETSHKVLNKRRGLCPVLSQSGLEKLRHVVREVCSSSASSSNCSTPVKGGHGSSALDGEITVSSSCPTAPAATSGGSPSSMPHTLPLTVQVKVESMEIKKGSEISDLDMEESLPDLD